MSALDRTLQPMEGRPGTRQVYDENQLQTRIYGRNRQIFIRRTHVFGNKTNSYHSASSTSTSSLGVHSLAWLLSPPIFSLPPKACLGIHSLAMPSSPYIFSPTSAEEALRYPWITSIATSPQEVDLVPGDEHTVSEHSKTPGIGGATTSSDTAISDIAISDTTISDIVISDTAISDTAIVDPVVTALAELQQMRGLHHSTFQALAALRMEISYHCGSDT
jgi:hypothetical protein